MDIEFWQLIKLKILNYHEALSLRCMFEIVRCIIKGGLFVYKKYIF